MRVHAEHDCVNKEQHAQTEHTQADDSHSHHGPTGKRDFECFTTDLTTLLAFGTDVDTLIQALCGTHGALRTEAEFAGGFLL